MMDPERPIEKLLRQAAQARRAEAGPPQELHSANRRMLQREVARKYASAAPPEKHSFFELFIPRIAWAAAVIVGLGLAASLMLPRESHRQSEMLLAKNDRLGTVNEALPPAVAASSNQKQAERETSPARSTTAPSEMPSLARADQSGRGATGAASLEVARAERDKDAMNLERRAEPQKQPLAFNEPAAGPQPAAGTTGTLTEEKQKKEIANAFSPTTPSQATPSQTPVVSDEMLQRRYGLTARAQGAASSPAPATASSSATKLGDEEARAQLALKTPPSGQTLTWSSTAAESNFTNSLDFAKRSPAPIARVKQKFVDATPANKSADFTDASATAKTILASFELQQLGREVRIVDSDGSVYTGTFQAPETFYYLHSAAAEKPVVTRSLQDSERQSGRKEALNDQNLLTDLRYSFRVSGTNQTLKQTVTFSGEVLTPTNALSILGSAGTVSGARFAPPELNPLPLGNSRITGKAVIGTSREIEVNAVPPH